MPHQCTECGRTFPDGSKEMLSGCPDCGGNKFQFSPASDGEDAGPDPEESPPDPPGSGGVTERVGRATATVKRWMSGSNRNEGAPSSDSSSSGAAGEDPTAGSTPTAGSASVADTDTDDGRDYGEWPNPEGADTSGVGKGPEARRSRSGSEDAREAGDGWPDATERADRRDDRTGTDSDEEDSAQASARTDVVAPDELPESPPDSATLGPSRSSGPDPTRADATTGSEAPDPEGQEGPDRPRSDALDEQPAGGADARVASEPEEEERPDLEDLREELNDQFESIKILQPGQYELNLMELYDREEYIISLQEDGRYVIEVPERWRDED